MKEVSLVHEWGARHQDVFAGLFLDGDDLHVGLTADIRKYRGELRALLPIDTRLHIFRARHTLAALRATVDEISRNLDALRKAGIHVSVVGVDDRQNVVTVHLSEARREWERQLRRRYGKIIAFGRPGWAYKAGGSGSRHA